jgi:hypothetical protein
MNKILTAEEFREGKNNYEDPILFVNRMMIEFAKLHVEAQAEAILKVTHKNDIPRIVDNRESILNAYPLTNIK